MPRNEISFQGKTCEKLYTTNVKKNLTIHEASSNLSSTNMGKFVKPFNGIVTDILPFFIIFTPKSESSHYNPFHTKLAQVEKKTNFIWRLVESFLVEARSLIL